MGNISVDLNAFRQAAGMDVSAYYVQQTGNPTVRLANDSPAENRRVREQLFASISSLNGIPDSYLEMIRGQLGLAEPDDPAAEEPLAETEVRALLNDAEKIVLAANAKVAEVMSHLARLTTDAAKDVLSHAVDAELSLLMTEIDCLGKMADPVRKAMLDSFVSEAQRRLAEAASDVKLMVAKAGPKDGKAVECALKGFLSQVFAINRLVQRAFKDEDFNPDDVEWPPRLDWSDVYEDSTRELNKLIEAARRSVHIPEARAAARREDLAKDAARIREALRQDSNEWTENEMLYGEIIKLLDTLCVARKTTLTSAGTPAGRNLTGISAATAATAATAANDTIQTLFDKPIMMKAAGMLGLDSKKLGSLKAGSVMGVALSLLTGTLTSIEENNAEDERREMHATVSGSRRRASELTGIYHRSLRV